MKFQKAKANPFYDDYGCFGRLESETGRWTYTFCPVMFGVRLQIGLTNSSSFSLDICCGKEESDIPQIGLIVLIWLESFEEQISCAELEAAFPKLRIKPVFLDSKWQVFVNQVIETHVASHGGDSA